MNANGGDDLESEDEYLNQNWHQNEDVEVAVDDSRKEVIERPPKKRNEPEIGESDDEEIVASKKSKPTKSPRSLLLEAGKGIADADRGEHIEIASEISFIVLCLDSMFPFIYIFVMHAQMFNQHFYGLHLLML
jgi:hypothetical protein